jgi:hypothetical protein
MFWGIVGVVVLTASANAGPIGTYYLTDFRNSSKQSSLDAIRGDVYSRNTSDFQSEEGPIAVFSPYNNSASIRTTGYELGKHGGDYSETGKLTVTSTGTTRTNGFANGVFDGTTDGTANYTVNFFSGAVIATDPNWSGTPVTLFHTGAAFDLGITYDFTNNSLWVQNFFTGLITNYTLQGIVIKTFATDSAFQRTALALDEDHTLWFADYGTGTIVHYSTDGVYLGSETYGGLEFAFGGEIANVPEPSTGFIQCCLTGLLGLILARRKWRGLEVDR